MSRKEIPPTTKNSIEGRRGSEESHAEVYMHVSHSQSQSTSVVGCVNKAMERRKHQTNNHTGTDILYCNSCTGTGIIAIALQNKIEIII